MTSGQRIVVVGGLSETEQVLKAVLEPQGLHVERIRDSECVDEPTSVTPPRLVVVHDEEPQATTHRVRVQRWNDVPHVIIGSADFTESAESNRVGQFLQKPFHYRELIQAIERLLREPESQSRAA